MINKIKLIGFCEQIVILESVKAKGQVLQPSCFSNMNSMINLHILLFLQSDMDNDLVGDVCDTNKDM